MATHQPKLWNFEFLELKSVSIQETHQSPESLTPRVTKKTNNEMSEKFSWAEGSPMSLYKCLKPLLIFARVIGILPGQNPFSGDLYSSTIQRKSVSGLVIFVCSLSLAFCSVVGVVSLFFKKDNKGVADMVLSLNPVIFYFMGFFCYSYLLARVDRLVTLMRTWDTLKWSCPLEVDRNLRRDLALIFGVIITSAILENLVQQLIQLSVLDLPETGNGTVSSSGSLLWPFEAYFQRTKQPNWSLLFPYHPLLSILMFVWNKMALYSWNFVDILVISVGRALSFQFKSLKKYADHHHVLTSRSVGLLGDQDVEEWQGLTRDFETVCGLLDKVNHFLSPLLFVSYFVNIFFMTVHIHLGLTPPASTGSSQNLKAVGVYRTWSFFHLTTRLWTLTYCAARVNENAEEVVDLFRKCPRACYTLDVQRADRFAKSRKLGFSGLSCFVVTKPFMLSLAGVLMTFEMVLLQTAAFSYF